MSYICCIAYAAMECDLDETPGRTCILRSPRIPDTFNWTCMYVSYELSSDDVKLTLDLLADNMVNISYIMLAKETAVWIQNPDQASSISVQLAASRYLVSADDYEHAIVSSVSFRPCSAHTGRLLWQIKRLI